MNTRGAIADLERRAYRSYLARVESERRLRRVGLFWNTAQTALAVGLIAVSVLYLAYPSHQSTLMLVYLISLSVLALAVSVTVGALDYSGRAREMFRNYRAIQALSVRIESERKSRWFVTLRFLKQAQSEYDLLLDNAENHSQVDWRVVEAKAQLREAERSPLIDASGNSARSTPADASHDGLATSGKKRAVASRPRGLWFRRALPFVLPCLLVLVACFTATSAIVTVTK